MDQQSLNQLNTLHPKVRQSAIDAWTEAQSAMPGNVRIVVTQSTRSFAESDHLYQIGRTIKGENASDKHPMGDTVTNSPGGSSYHNYSLAFDFSMITNGKIDWIVGPNWMKVVEIMKKHGWSWGGDFKRIYDAPHFEKTLGYGWRDLLAMHNSAKFIEGTEYLDI